MLYGETGSKSANRERPINSGRQSRALLSPAIRLTSILGLSLLFILAAIDKIAHYDRFVTALNSYVVVPPGWARYLATGVILAELCVGFGLLHRQYRGVAALAMSTLLVIFSIALAINVSLGITGGCGCWFTITLGKASFAHVVQDLFLALLALSIWYEASRHAAEAVEHASRNA
ncbi:MAG: MauE/DoxX family redox-associated membrane protein [Terriglobia bacterium]